MVPVYLLSGVFLVVCGQCNTGAYAWYAYPLRVDKTAPLRHANQMDKR